ncbi:MAG: BatA and WFA domain-containing protein [Myxococcota bacterium]
MGSWSFLHPALLVGLVGASIPLVIHLIGKRRAPTVRFAAFDFLVAINKQLARRERLRQFLLLLLRTLAIAAAVFAVARPTRSQAVLAPTTSRRLALVFDASSSMAYRLDGSTLLERGQRMARDVVAGLQPGDAVALVIAGPEVRAPFQVPNADLNAVRRAIDGIEAAEGYADLGTAIETALAQLGDDAAGAELMVIGDLSRNSFSSIRPTALDPPPGVRLLDVASREDARPLPNLAVERVDVTRSPESASERVFAVTVRNYGDTEVKRRPLEFRIGDEVTQRSFVTVGPRSTEEKRLTVRFEGTGAYRCEVRLSPDREDGLEADDRYRLQVELNRGVGVLAINGDPRTTPYDDELFFVERALQSVPSGDSPIRLRIVAADELRTPDSAIALDGFDVVLLANVSELPSSVVASLSEAVGDGLGVVFALGPRVEFERANQVFGSLLPNPLRDLFRAADEVTGAPPLAIDELDTEHPILRGLDEAFTNGLRGSRTGRYFNVDVGASQRARTVLRFENGAPALLERASVEGGRVLLFTTALDVDMSDIALRTAFPALVQRTMRYAAGALGGGGVRPVRQNGFASVPLPTGASKLELTAPSGTSEELAPDSASQRAIETEVLPEVGYYTARVRDKEWQRAELLDIPVNVSLEESDYSPVSVERVSGALGGDGGRSPVLVSMGTQGDSDPFSQRGPATYLLLAFALFFIGESVLASRG